jgi:ankyrin repeat protein
MGKFNQAVSVGIKNGTIHKVDLSNDNIGDLAAVKLSMLLKDNPKLEKLNLSQNKIGSQGLKALADALEVNTNLVEMDLRGNSVPLLSVDGLVEAKIKKINFFASMGGAEQYDPTSQMYIEQIDKYLKRNQEKITLNIEQAKKEEKNETLAETTDKDHGQNNLPKFLTEKLSIEVHEEDSKSLSGKNLESYKKHFSNDNIKIEINEIKSVSLIQNNVPVAQIVEPHQSTTSIDIQQEIDPNVVALHNAISIGDESKIRGLLENNTLNINEKNVVGFSALHYAAKMGNASIIGLLITKGALKNSSNQSGETPLHIAAKHNHCQVMEILFNYQVEIDIENKEGDTPLYYAIQNGHKEAVRKLLEKKAKIFHRNKQGNNALHIVAETSYKELTQLLLYKADIQCMLGNNKGQSPLHVSYLKSKIDDRSRSNTFPLFIDFVHEIKNESKKKEILSYEDCDNYTILHLAAARSDERTLEILIINKGMSVDLQNKMERTPLHIAIENGSLLSVTYLLDKGARLDLEDVTKNTAFDIINNIILSNSIKNRERDYEEIKTKLAEKKHKIIIEIIKKSLAVISQTIFRDVINKTLDVNTALKLFIKNNEYKYLIEAARSIGQFVQEGLANERRNVPRDLQVELVRLVDNTVEDAIEKAQSTDKDRLMKQSISALLEYQTILVELNSGFKMNNESQITHEEKEFIEASTEFLRKYYYVSAALIEEIVHRQATTVDRGVALANQAASFLPTVGSKIGELIPHLAKGIEANVASKVGMAVGTIAEFLVSAITNIIIQRLDENARVRAGNVVRAFKQENRDRLNDDKINAVVMVMVLRFRDQINELDLFSVKPFAECIGIRIINHILKGLNENVNESSWPLGRWINKRQEGYKKATQKQYSPPEELNIVKRCMLAIKNEYDGRAPLIRLTTKAKRSENERWFAHGIIELTGMKTIKGEQEKFSYFTSKESQHNIYGFCYVSTEDAKKAVEEDNFKEINTAIDIFSQETKEVASTSSCSKMAR